MGRLGRVSVRFHSHGKPKQVSPSHGICHGGDQTVESGTWIGRIDFAGEQGYTAVHATRAKGAITDSPKQTCNIPAGKEGGSPGFQATILSVSSDARLIFSNAFLITSEIRPGLDGASFTASLLEVHRRGLSIIRSIHTDAKSDAFALSKEGGHITSATVTPPAPSSGTATFQRTSDSKTRDSKGSWTGTLAGDFPGRGEVTLAGPEFSAEVSRMNF